MEFTSEIKVELIQHTGSDRMIASAARVSTGADLMAHGYEDDHGLIKYLMKNRHGSPFEHGSITLRVEAPIFVFREWQRHRTESFNEVSGRYKKLDPKFYIYPEDRPLVQTGSGAHPKLGQAGGLLHTLVNGEIVASAKKSWRAYEAMLEAGAATEVARAVLPVNTYSSMYVTLNPRALMHFLSLRVDHVDNTFSTKPQWEIQKAAEQVEDIFKSLFPQTWIHWHMNGRIAP